MGYYTAYEMEVIEGDQKLIEEFRNSCEGAEYALNNDGTCREPQKWYDCQDDLRNFSIKHPEALFRITGNGEDDYDFWQLYARAGKTQFCPGYITYEPFNEELLS